jgi:hypothetical protein
MIAQIDLHNYFYKKQELQKALATCSNKTLREKYGHALRLTDQAFELYGVFYNSFQSLIDQLISYYGKYDTDHKMATSILIDSYKQSNEIDHKLSEINFDSISTILDQFFNYKKHTSDSLSNMKKIIDISSQNHENVRKIVDDQAKLLKAILEPTVDILFLYIYKADMADINSKVMSEFTSFVAGLVSKLDPFASGLVAIMNILKVRSTNIKSADTVLNYLDNYNEAISIWAEITKGYVAMLNEWRDFTVTSEK